MTSGTTEHEARDTPLDTTTDGPRSGRRSRGARRRRVAGIPLAVGLSGIGGLHLLWATGATWPYDDKDAFARHVTGTQYPPAPASAAVGVALVAGAYLALSTGGFARRIGPKRLHGLGIAGLTAVLLGRGLLGPLTHRGAASEYVRLDWRLYSPLCLVLGTLALAVATGYGLAGRGPAEPSTDADVRDSS
ncbi:DUF3995 domain-containing protein [Yinghuangia seranimata]|uniref:DUF3995 domain-containing protein n=1 Tax=Yinghuangia seranimata TaxID=408067 RepID=UPI00248BF279|nr:DUF3995 domain-containing protein [Yinghuangia seranimata]MDI2127329.1 DUF3995 domain-containing protein [Yinghuangia seranimata]